MEQDFSALDIDYMKRMKNIDETTEKTNEYKDAIKKKRIKSKIESAVNLKHFYEDSLYNEKLQKEKTCFFKQDEKLVQKLDCFTSEQFLHNDKGEKYDSVWDKLYLQNYYSSYIRNQKMKLINRNYRILHEPYRTLYIDGMIDDFYSNLLSWSNNDLLAVGLNNQFKIYNLKTFDLHNQTDLHCGGQILLSLKWSNNGILATGLSNGKMDLWDINKQIILFEHATENNRITSMDWLDNVLAFNDKNSIFLFDQRSPVISSYNAMKSQTSTEICGIKWSRNGLIAAGASNGKLFAWDLRHCASPLFNSKIHVAAVKALSWSPNSPYIIASGGGIADRTIRITNTTNGATIQQIDTLSQVCNMAWSPMSDEIISTHGYTGSYIYVWESKKLQPITKISKHSKRVLQLALSPDGNSFCTSSSDQVIHLWSLNSKKANSLHFYNNGSDEKEMIR